jgi:hypothetical protein
MNKKIHYFGFIVIVFMMNACTVYQERNDHGFGGGNTSKGYANQRQTIQPSKDLLNSNFETQCKIVLENTTQQTKKIDSIHGINQTQNKSTLKKNKKTSQNSLHRLAIKYLHTNKLKKSKLTKSFFLDDILPFSDSGLGYWMVFILFCACVIGAFFSFLSNSLHPGNYADVLGVLFILFGIIYYVGLKDHENWGSNFIHDFGYVTSMIPFTLIFGFGIPLLLWIIGSAIG